MFGWKFHSYYKNKLLHVQFSYITWHEKTLATCKHCMKVDNLDILQRVVQNCHLSHFWLSSSNIKWPRSIQTAGADTTVNLANLNIKCMFLDFSDDPYSKSNLLLADTIAFLPYRHIYKDVCIRYLRINLVIIYFYLFNFEQRVNWKKRKLVGILC